MMHSNARPALSALAAILLLVVVGLGACSGDGAEQRGDRPPTGGADSARAALDAHIGAMKRYDLLTDCRLRSPSKQAEMAQLDGVPIKGYCKEATREPRERATDQNRADNRRIYTGARVVQLEESPVFGAEADPQLRRGTWFRVTAKDRSHTEHVQVVKERGRWWIGEFEEVETDHADRAEG